jgi:hypothetical protein
MPLRKIVLVHLTDGGTRTFIDDGCSKTGQPNVARQQLIRALSKRVIERGENGEPVVGANGRPITWPLFRLAGPPPAMQYNLTDPDQHACAEKDTLDAKHLCTETNDWIVPSAAWLEASARLRGKRQQLQDEVDAAEIARAQANVGRDIQELMTFVRDRAPSAAPKKGTRSAEAQPPA